MQNHSPAFTWVPNAVRPRALPMPPLGGYPPVDLDADCPWRMSQSTRRTSVAVTIGIWVLLAMFALLVSRVLMGG